MKISFIGSGNVATHLALAFYNRGHKIQQIWSRSQDHAELLANRVEAQPISNIALLDTTANIYIVAISDDALYHIADSLHFGNALVLHTSGATPIHVLKGTSSRYGVLWSPQTFVRDMALDYSELPFCIEGNTPNTENAIEEFIGMISQHIYHTNHQQRQYLHLSAVFVNNFTNVLYTIAQDICHQQNVSFEILYPLILNTAKKAEWGDIRHQLTGPAARNDKKTLDAHRKLLANDKKTLDIYNEFTKLIQQIKK